MGLGIPPLNIEIMLESKLLQSRILVQRLVLVVVVVVVVVEVVEVVVVVVVVVVVEVVEVVVVVVVVNVELDMEVGGLGLQNAFATCLNLTGGTMRGCIQSHRWNRNPRPQPQKFSKLVFLLQFIQLISHVSKLVIWGSSLGWGFRSHWLHPIGSSRALLSLRFRELLAATSSSPPRR